MTRVVVETTRLNADKPLIACQESWVVATDLAEALARNGTPFHKAHQLAGKLVLESIKQNRKPSEWTAEQLVAFAPEFTAEMVKLMDPAEGMKTRTVQGATGPAAVAQALNEAEARLMQMR